MTDQIEDELKQKQRVFKIKGVKGNGYFKPEDFDLYPFSTSTNCRRGYRLFFLIKDNQLILTDMNINSNSTVLINKKEPEPLEKEFKLKYSNLNLLCKFTGKLLLFQIPIKNSKQKAEILIIHFKEGNMTEEEYITNNNIKKIMEFRRS